MHLNIPLTMTTTFAVAYYLLSATRVKAIWLERGDGTHINVIWTNNGAKFGTSTGDTGYLSETDLNSVRWQVSLYGGVNEMDIKFDVMEDEDGR